MSNEQDSNIQIFTQPSANNTATAEKPEIQNQEKRVGLSSFFIIKQGNTNRKTGRDCGCRKK